MKTQLTKERLMEAMDALKGLAAKDALSPFSRILVDATGGGNVSLSASDGNVLVTFRTVDVETEVPGCAALPGILFSTFAGAMPEGVVTLDGEGGKKVKIEGGAVKYAIATGEAADFPVMKGPETESRIYIQVATLREMLRKVKFAASVDETRKALCGVNIAMKANKLEMTATDGRRLGHVEHDWMGDDMAFTLPNKMVGILWRLLAKEVNGEILVKSDGKAASFTGGKWNLTTKLPEDMYPNWRRVVPEATAHKAEIDRKAFVEDLKRVALAMGEADVDGVKTTIKPGCLTLEARNTLASGKIESAACRVADDAKVTLHINPWYLIQALEVVDEDEITMEWNDAESPIVLKCMVPWVAVVMPLRTA